MKIKKELFVLKRGRYFFGAIQCMGEDIVLRTENPSQANLFPENEAVIIQESLLKYGIRTNIITQEEAKQEYILRRPAIYKARKKEQASLIS